MDEDRLRAWFLREVLPHEAVVLRLIRRQWRDPDEVRDLRQDIYVRVLRAAAVELPLQVRPFLLATARNHLINEAKRRHIVPIDYVADLDPSSLDADDLHPERHALARDELRRVKAGIEQLPARCQEVVRLRRVEGLSAKEVADRLHITPQTVERQLNWGMRALVNFILGGTGKLNRSANTADGGRLEL